MQTKVLASRSVVFSILTSLSQWKSTCHAFTSTHFLRTGSRLSPQDLLLKASIDDISDSTGSQVDPEEAMKSAFARLLVLTAESAPLFDIDNETGNHDDNDNPKSNEKLPSFFGNIDSKWQGHKYVPVENDELYTSKRNGGLLEGNIIATSNDASELIEAYQETYRILEESVADSNKQIDGSVPVWASYVENNHKSDTVSVAVSTRDEDDGDKDLIPEANPSADLHAESLAGVRYMDVLSGLFQLFPPEDLRLRNAASRKDGYWKFVSKGENPPKHLTYGEFDFYFFAELLDRSRYYYQESKEKALLNEAATPEEYSWENMTFTDIGSGTGRLVFAAAALHPGFKLCRGLEILPTIKQVAEQNLEKCRVCNEDRDTDDIDGNIDSRRPRAFPFTMQSDEEWLETFSGKFLLGQDAPKDDDIIEKEDDIDCVEDEEEWENPDSWAATRTVDVNLDMDSDNKGGDEHGEDGEWESLDPFVQQSNVPSDTFQSIGDTTGDGDENSDSLPSEEDTEGFFLKCDLDDGAKGQQLLPLAPIEFNCGSFDDPYEYFGDSDVVFVFSSCMSQDMMESLSKAIGRQCKPGSIVITTEFPLLFEGFIGEYRSTVDLEDQDETSLKHDLPCGPYKIEMLEKVDGWCWLTGGESTAYIHRVRDSLWEEGVGQRERPKPCIKQKARGVIEAIRCGDLTDSEDFIRKVQNNVIFHGLSNELSIHDDDSDDEEVNTSCSSEELFV